MMERKKFIDPVLEKYDEKLDEITKSIPVGSCAEDFD
jgi:hypothetical protein